MVNTIGRFRGRGVAATHDLSLVMEAIGEDESAVLQTQAPAGGGWDPTGLSAAFRKPVAEESPPIPGRTNSSIWRQRSILNTMRRFSMIGGSSMNSPRRTGHVRAASLFETAAQAQPTGLARLPSVAPSLVNADGLLTRPTSSSQELMSRHASDASSQTASSGKMTTPDGTVSRRQGRPHLRRTSSYLAQQSPCSNGSSTRSGDAVAGLTHGTMTRSSTKKSNNSSTLSTRSRRRQAARACGEHAGKSFYMTVSGSRLRRIGLSANFFDRPAATTDLET